MRWAWALAPAFLALAAYAPSLQVGFLLDDFPLGAYYHRLTLAGVLREFGSPWLGTQGYKFYRPLVTLVGYLDMRVWGLTPWGWHLTNVLLHAGTTALVSLLCLRLFGVQSALLGGAWFALHPLHAENVCWVSGRTDLLAAFWSAAACLLYVSRRRGALVASWLAAAAALAAKEAAMLLPLLLVALQATLRPRGRRFRHLLPFVVLGAAYLLLRWHLFGKLLPSHRRAADLVLDASELARNLGHQLLLLAAPVDRVSFPGGWQVAMATLVGGVLSLFLLGRLAALPGRTLRILSGGALVLIPALAPALPVAVSLETLLGGRVLYLPSLVCAACLAALAPLGGRAGRTLLVLHTLGLGVLLFPTLNRWVAAGRWTKETLARLDARHRAVGLEVPLYVLDPPEHRRGVYALFYTVAYALAPPFNAPRRVVPLSQEFFRELLAVGGPDQEAGPVLVAWFKGGGFETVLLEPEPPVVRPVPVSRWRRTQGGWRSPPLNIPGRAVAGVRLRFAGVTPPVTGVFRWGGAREGEVRFRLVSGEELILFLAPELAWTLAPRISFVAVRCRGAARLVAAALLTALPQVEVLAPGPEARFRYEGPEPVFRFRLPGGPSFDAWRIRVFSFLHSAKTEGALAGAAAPDGTVTLPWSKAFRRLPVRRIRVFCGPEATLIYTIELLREGRVEARSPPRLLHFSGR